MTGPISDGWIGVDFDGTTAVYTGWNGGSLGEPIPEMIKRIKAWLAQGYEVRIFTARVGASGLPNKEGTFDDEAFAQGQREKVEAWSLKHIGRKLRVTSNKDFGMIEIYDDRAVQVEQNTGRLLGNSSRGLTPEVVSAEESALDKIKKTFQKALEGCMKCEYDEAEGGIEIHCAECQLKVAQLAWRTFVVGETPQ